MIFAKYGNLGTGMTLHRVVRNSSAWISIAKFLEKDALKALGLEGGWARTDGACEGEGAPLPDFVTPPSNTGVNDRGPVARVSGVAA